MAFQRRLRLETLERRQLFASDFFETISPSGDGVRAAEVRIQFDPEKVTPQAADFLPGSAWQGKGAIVTNVDASEGTVTAFLFSVEPINATSGELIDIRLPVGPALPDELTPAYAIESIKVDEGQKAIDPLEHRVDPVVSEEIKRQVQSRQEHVIASTNVSDLQPAVVDQVYGPLLPSWLPESNYEVFTPTDVAEGEAESTSTDSELATHEDCSWNEFLSAEPVEKGISRSVLLAGVRDDWSELDRLGYRKA